MVNIIPTLTVMDSIEEYTVMIDNYIKSKSNIFRCNATRFDNDIYIKSITTLQKLYYARTHKNFKLLLDIPFPKDKIRIEFSKIQNQIEIKKGEMIYIYNDKKNMMKENDLYVNISLSNIKVEEKLIIGDGDVILKVVKNTKQKLLCIALNSGVIGYRKACYFRNQYCHITDQEKIYKLFKLIRILNPEYIAFSFVEDASDINEINNI